MINVQSLIYSHEVQQNEAIEKLDAVNQSYVQALEAVAQGDNTLKEANNTYYTLSGFQNQVEDSSNKAKIALEGVDRIEELINQAIDLNDKTDNVRIHYPIFYLELN